MILKWESKDERAFAPKSKFLLNPAKIAYWYWYQLVWYQYQKSTGSPTALGYRYHSDLVPVPQLHCISLHVGTSTSQCGTCTNVSTVAPIHFTTARGLSTTSGIDSDDLQLSSGTKSLRKCAWDIEQLAHA